MEPSHARGTERPDANIVSEADKRNSSRFAKWLRKAGLDASIEFLQAPPKHRAALFKRVLLPELNAPGLTKTHSRDADRI